jgi:hypothetical protein
VYLYKIPLPVFHYAERSPVFMLTEYHTLHIHDSVKGIFAMKIVLEVSPKLHHLCITVLLQ